MNKIKLQKTPTPPPAPIFSSAMEFLDERPVHDAIEEINADEFAPKAFKMGVVKEKAKETTSFATPTTKIQTAIPMDDSIFHEKVSFRV